MAVSGTNAGHKKHSTWNGFAYVRFGSKADMCAAKRNVRFTPNSDRESDFRTCPLYPPKADMRKTNVDLRLCLIFRLILTQGDNVNALLVRVAADQSPGGGLWNGPIDSRSNDYVYVSIPETRPIRPGMEKPYKALIPALSKFGVCLPAHLALRHMHLDPDFDHLTYGDQGERAKQLSALVGNKGDVIVFYAGLKDAREEHLIYAIIGIFFVDEIVFAAKVPPSALELNAHTRRILPDNAQDIVVRAKANVSGRLQRCIPIGEWRDNAYRVRRHILEAWGGLSVKDGYLQRSARLPAIRKPDSFLHWFHSQAPVLLRENN